jgi:hypothetical protein
MQKRRLFIVAVLDTRRMGANLYETDARTDFMRGS